MWKHTGIRDLDAFSVRIYGDKFFFITPLYYRSGLVVKGKALLRNTRARVHIHMHVHIILKGGRNILSIPRFMIITVHALYSVR